MSKKVSIDELLDRIYDAFRDLPKSEFIEEVNNILGTEYREDDIEWEIEKTYEKK